MKKIFIYAIMWVVSTIMSLGFLKLANEFGGYWINVSWAFGILLGIESSLFFQIIIEWEKECKLAKR